MQKTIKVILIMLISVFTTVSISFSSENQKIGLIDFQRILQESSAGKIAQKNINEKGKELEANLKEMKAKIEELQNNLEREALVMSREKREQRQREIRIQINDFKQRKVKYKNDFQALENRIISRIQKEVFEIARLIGESGGYLLIMEKSTAGVLYSPDSIDITDNVIAEYNEALARQEDDSE